MATKIEEMEDKLFFITVNLSKGDGAYSLDPDKEGQNSAFLKKHNLNPTMAVADRVSALRKSLKGDPSKQDISAANELIRKWHSPLADFDRMKEVGGMRPKARKKPMLNLKAQ